jgi:hypothetical protein
VEEDYRAGAHRFEHPLDDGFVSGLLVVGGLHRPEDHEHAVATGQLQGGVVVDAERGPKEPRERRPLVPQFGRLVEQLRFLFGGRQAREPGVVLGVVADREAVLHLALDGRRVFVDHEPDRKEGRGGPHADQGVEDFPRVGAGAVVEGERHLPLAPGAGAEHLSFLQQGVDRPVLPGDAMRGLFVPEAAAQREAHDARPRCHRRRRAHGADCEQQRQQQRPRNDSQADQPPPLVDVRQVGDTERQPPRAHLKT